MMNLTLNRQRDTGNSYIGHFFNGDDMLYYSLENRALAIPAGTYPIQMIYSPRFGRNIPHILNVPNRTAIEIHPANNYQELRGCVAIGYKLNDDNTISESRKASDDLNAMIQKEQDDGGEIEITINDIVDV